MNSHSFYCFSILKHFVVGISHPHRLAFKSPGPDGGSPEAPQTDSDKPAEDLDQTLETSRNKLKSAKKSLYERVHGYVIGSEFAGGIQDAVKGHGKVPAVNDAQKVLSEAQQVLDGNPTNDEEKKQRITESEEKTKQITQINEALDALEYRETVRRLQAAVSGTGVSENSKLRDTYDGLLFSYPAITPTSFTQLNTGERDRQVYLLRENLDKGPQRKDDLKALNRLVRDNTPNILLIKAQQEVDMAVQAEIANIKNSYPTYPIEQTLGKQAERATLENRIQAINRRDEGDPFIKALNQISQFYYEAFQRRTTHDLVRSPESDENSKLYVNTEAEASKNRMAFKAKELQAEIKDDPNNPDNSQKQQKITQLGTLPEGVDALKASTLQKLSTTKGPNAKENLLNNFRVDLNIIENKPNIA